MALPTTGVSPSYKVPRYIARLMFAAGPSTAGSQRLKCLLVGMKTSAGAIVADAAPVRVTSEAEADTQAGPGGQLALMAYAALSIPGAEVWLAAVTEPGAGTAATATMVISGSWVAGGTLAFRLAGKTVRVDYGPTSTIDDVGAAIVSAFNAKTRLPATAAYNSSTDTVTLTLKNKGAGGKDWTLYYDSTNASAGIVITLAGSANQNVAGVRFGASSSGTGVEDVTTLLPKLTKTRYARIALGHNDATNAGLWETHVNTKAAETSLLLDQLVFAHNGTKAQAKSLAQTTLNAFRAQMLWLRNSENHPAEIAALMAAVRSTVEQESPVPDYDGYALSYLAPQAFDDDLPSDAEQDEVLNAGVTPLTTVDATIRVVRAVCSYCMSGGVQDERCLDIGDVVMTDYAALDGKALYDTEFRPQNPYVRADPAPEEELPSAGVAFPRLWNTVWAERLQLYYRNNWLAYPPSDPKWAPQSFFNTVGGFIVTDTPLPIAQVQHRMDNVLRQIRPIG